MTHEGSLNALLPAAFRDRHRDRYVRLKERATILYGRLTRGRRAQRWRRRAAELGSDLRVHIGCGLQADSRFLNVDLYPYPHVDLVQGIEEELPLLSASARLVYSSHCLEHVSYLKSGVVLNEWSRVLAPGGVLRVAVPDLDALLSVYEYAGRSPELILPALLGGHRNGLDYHSAAFTYGSLAALFARAGLTEIRRWSPGEDPFAHFEDYSAWKLTAGGREWPVSLNVQGTRAG